MKRTRTRTLKLWIPIAVVLIGAMLAGCTGVSAEVVPPAAAKPLDPTSGSEQAPTPEPPATATPVPEPTPELPALNANIFDVLWQWERLSGADEILVDDPARYTLELLSDGTYRLQADCNRAGGAYTLEGDRLVLHPGPTTLAACAPGSLYDVYLARLGEAAQVTMDGDRLVLALGSEDDAPTMVFAQGTDETTELVPDIVGVTWAWQRFEGGDGSVLDVSDPSLYTLDLQPDGTFHVRVDCNRGSGAYTLESSSLVLELGPLTRAMCPPDSLHDRYLRDLSNVRTYVHLADENTLVLNLWADAGNMVFRLLED